MYNKTTMGEKPKYRLSTSTSIILVIFATIADLISLIPFAGDIVGWLFWSIMAVVFWKLGLGLINYRRFLPLIMSTVAEFIPFIQEFPTIMAGMIAVIILSRIEDKTGIKMLPSKGKGGVRMPQKTREPVNLQEGVRQPRTPIRELELEAVKDSKSA